MKRKINARMLLLVVLSMILTLVATSWVFYGVFARQVQADLAQSARLVCALYELNKTPPELEHVAGDDLRITLIAPDGTVLFENRADATGMVNHLSREENQAALKTGTGTATRRSDTLGLRAYYHATRMSDGNILRVSVEAADSNAVLRHALPVLALVFLVLLVFSFVLTRFVTQRLIPPIVAMAEQAVPRAPYPELAPFADALREQQNEQMENERIRKDFTANVSHELKTPLTSISGYAEMIKTGMAKEEDIKEFAEKIYAEAGRMITLIGDIIQLSELDEPNAAIEMTQVDLTDLARSTAELLAFPAEKRGVTILVEGERCMVQGNRGLLEELIYNLCDNAIRYNKPNGQVTIRVSHDGTLVNLWVSDTGIGIPMEHQARVFERFYRVDKSRSKETGGTGLGLAIVKHIAEQHKAVIRIESYAGEGTTIKVTFSAP